MKKLFALPILLFFSVTGLTQEYRPFPTSNTYWSYLVNTGNGGGNLLQSATLIYRQFMLTGADTIISSYTYKTVIKREYRDSATNAVPAYVNKIANVADEMVLAIREDNKKVFAILFPTTTEILLYDFNNVIGDTMKYLPTANKKEITGSDSVLIGTKYHKRWLTDNSLTDVIEGVGSIQGIFGMLNGQNTVVLTCFNNGSGTYSYGNASCFYIHKQGTPAGVAGIKTQVSVSVAPNPFNDKLTIHSDSPVDLMIYNSLGQQVAVEKQVMNKTINTVAFPAGIYFADVENKDTRQMIKLVK